MSLSWCQWPWRRRGERKDGIRFSKLKTGRRCRSTHQRQNEKSNFCTNLGETEFKAVAIIAEEAVRGVKVGSKADLPRETGLAAYGPVPGGGERKANNDNAFSGGTPGGKAIPWACRPEISACSFWRWNSASWACYVSAPKGASTFSFFAGASGLFCANFAGAGVVEGVGWALDLYS